MIEPQMKTDLKNQFASDNYSGICPEAWEAMAAVNSGYANSYGDDPWTERACDLLRDFFETDCQVFFVFNGTAANSLALASLCNSYHSLICHETAHVETDECGAAEFFSNGTKILLVPGANGKIDLEAVQHTVTRRKDIHYPKPKALTITQATELGTVYSQQELIAIGGKTHELGLRLHMDGARLANAVASLDVAPADVTWRAGVDVLTLGGTKNGMAMGEAVVFFKPELAEEFDYRCKQAGQLASKMRFLAAPWIGLLESGAFLRNAAHANHHAELLESAMRKVPGLEVIYPRQANAVFVSMPPALIKGLKKRGWHFYTFIGLGHCRFMCSWNTTTADIAALETDLHELSPDFAE